MLAGEGGQHGWQNLIRWIFASGLFVRLRKVVCRGTGGVAVWHRGLDGDQLGAALSGDGQRCAGPDGWAQTEKIRGEHRTWLLARTQEKDFTLRGLVAEFADRGLKVDYHTVWDFVHAEKLSFKKNRHRQ